MANWWCRNDEWVVLVRERQRVSVCVFWLAARWLAITATGYALLRFFWVTGYRVFTGLRFRRVRLMGSPGPHNERFLGLVFYFCGAHFSLGVDFSKEKACLRCCVIRCPRRPKRGRIWEKSGPRAWKPQIKILFSNRFLFCGLLLLMTFDQASKLCSGFNWELTSP